MAERSKRQNEPTRRSENQPSNNARDYQGRAGAQSRTNSSVDAAGWSFGEPLPRDYINPANVVESDRTMIDSMSIQRPTQIFSGRGDQEPFPVAFPPYYQGTRPQTMNPNTMMHGWDGDLPETQFTQGFQVPGPQPAVGTVEHWRLPATQVPNPNANYGEFYPTGFPELVPMFDASGLHPNAYSNTPQHSPSYQAGQASPILVQLGASQNYLINSRPARYIQVLDVDPTYQSTRATLSRESSSAFCLLVRASPEDTMYRAIYLRERTVKELIRSVMEKYGHGTEEKERVIRAVRETEDEAAVLRDEDVAVMEAETEMIVGVKSISPESWEWQLEVIY